MARNRASMREGPLAELFRATEAAQRGQKGERHEQQELLTDPEPSPAPASESEPPEPTPIPPLTCGQRRESSGSHPIDSSAPMEADSKAGIDSEWQ